MVKEFHALGIAYKHGKNKGYVITRFVVSGNRVIREELISPEPEPANFSANRLISCCRELLQAAREDAECSHD